MEPRLEIRVDLLKTAMQEDRIETRLIKDKIYSICTFITISSFAVTSFIIGPKNESITTIVSWKYFLLIDISFLLLLWVLFIRLKIDLQNARICLEAREYMISNVHKHNNEIFNPFPAVDMRKMPRISENGLYWIVCIASFALIVKLIVVCAIKLPLCI